MVGGKAMKSIIFKDGLLYIDAVLTHGNKTFKIKNALVDTGSFLHNAMVNSLLI